MQTIVNHKFDTGDEVYHVTTESPKGIIIEWFYSSYTNHVKYFVVFGHTESDQVTCTENELTFDKSF